MKPDRMQIRARLHAKAITLTLLCYGSTGCQHPDQTVSSKGIDQCRSETALELASGQSQQARQAAFRRCLRTIDARIQLKDKSKETERAASTELNNPQEKATNAATPSMIMTFCSSNRDRIKQRVQDYNIVTGEISRQMNLGSNTDLGDLEQRQQVIMSDLEQMVPFPYRLGLPLFPDATGLLMRCDQQEILSVLTQ